MMMVVTIRKLRNYSPWASSLVFFLMCILGNMCLGEEVSMGDELGEIMIEGEFVTHLVMQDKHGRLKVFDQPPESIKLRAGEYFVREVHLKGEYISDTYQVPGSTWITVSEDKPVVLKIGAPLKQILKVKRQGKYLRLTYELLGAGGRKYVSEDKNIKPRFVVYKGDKQIKGADFGYL